MSVDLENIEVQHNPEEKRFEVKLGNEVAMVEYMLAGTNIVFNSYRSATFL